MKKIVMTACLLCSMALGAWADATQTITVNGQSVTGKTVASISFEGDNAVVRYSDNSTETSPIEQVKISFAYSTTGIKTVSVFNFTGIVDGQLHLSGLKAGALIQVFDTAGRVQARAKAADGDTVLDVNSLNSGVYMVRVGNQVIKFMKK